MSVTIVHWRSQYRFGSKGDGLSNEYGPDLWQQYRYSIANFIAEYGPQELFAIITLIEGVSVSYINTRMYACDWFEFSNDKWELTCVGWVYGVKPKKDEDECSIFYYPSLYS